jgi:hypothetical protein
MASSTVVRPREVDHQWLREAHGFLPKVGVLGRELSPDAAVVSRTGD